MIRFATQDAATVRVARRTPHPLPPPLRERSRSTSARDSRSFLILSSVIAFFVLGSPASFATDRYVWDQSPHPDDPAHISRQTIYTEVFSAAHTIHEAVNLAFPGDTIFVFGGPYNSEPTIVIQPDQILRGGTASPTQTGGGGPAGGGTSQANFVDGHCSVTVIGHGSGPVFVCARSATIRGFEISDNIIGGEGAGVKCGRGTVTISDCCFLRLVAKRGGGLYADHTVLSISKCTFDHNLASSTDGGAVYLDTVVRATLTGNHFFDNIVPIRGGAILVRAGTDVRVQGNEFRRNNAGEVGGAITIAEKAQRVVIRENQIANNHCPDGLGHGGGIAVIDCFVEPAVQIILHDEFRDNTAEIAGGGIYVQDSKVRISDNRFQENKVEGNDTYGGAVGLRGTGKSDVDLTGNRFIKNSARNGSGGAIGILGYDETTDETANDVAGLGNVRFTISGNLFQENHAGGYNTKGVGGALFCKSRDVVGTVQGNHFFKNDAEEDAGGIAALALSRPKIKNNDVDQNKTDGDAGGVFIASFAGSGVLGTAIVGNSPVPFWDNVVHDNVAKDTGGGVRVTSLARVIIHGGEIRDNHAIGVAGPPEQDHQDGGGLYVRDAEVKVQGTLIRGNTAGRAGGGVFVATAMDQLVTTGPAEVLLTGVTVSGNVAPDGAGIRVERFPLSPATDFKISGGSVTGNHLPAGPIAPFTAGGISIREAVGKFSIEHGASVGSNDASGVAFVKGDGFVDILQTRDILEIKDNSTITANARGVSALRVGVGCSNSAVTSNPQGGFQLIDTDADVRDSRLIRNGDEGHPQVYMSGAGDVKLRHTLLEGADVVPVGILASADASPTIHQCDIQGHSVWGVSFDPPGIHTGALLLDAKENWWGNPNGPDDSSNDVPGGDFHPNVGFQRVSDGVKYQDWLPAPVNQ